LDIMVGLSMPDDLKTAVEILASNAEALRVFDAIEAAHGKASGWAIAKSTEIEPEAAAQLLKTLKQTGIVASTDAGLDGYYYLTSLGVSLRSAFGRRRVAV